MHNHVRKIFVMLIAMLLCVGAIVACQVNAKSKNSNIESESIFDTPDVSEVDASQRQDGQEMPPIVFLCRTAYYSTNFQAEGYPGSDIEFWDNRGNKYYSDASGVCDLSYVELCDKHEKGELNEFLELKKTCDSDEVYEKYKQLMEVVQNEEFAIITERLYPEAMTDLIWWYGLYYDENGDLSIIILQQYRRMKTEYANDKNAVEICEWF